LAIVPASNWAASTDPNSNQLGVGGMAYRVQGAGQPWSLTSPAANTLRFELRPGDHWSPADPFNVERSEIAGTTEFSIGTPIHVSYGFAIEPGPPNDAKWLVAGQLHQTALDGRSPPFAIDLVGDRMAIVINVAGGDPRGSSQYVTVFADAQDIVRGHTYAMDIDAGFDPVNGRLTVERDGVTLVNYSGPMGYDGMGSVYWKEGVYRAASGTVIAIDYSDLSVSVGGGVRTIQGSDGPDTLAGDAGAASRLLGGFGDDVINSQGAFDTINGNAGNDTVHGGSGHDVISGGKDTDALFADSGADTINGNLGADTIFGGAGDSMLRGGAGDDVLVGGAGNDQIWGDRGSDIAKGGAGADTFHVYAGAGVTTVLDFQQGEGDRVRVDDGAPYATIQVGTDVVIDLGNGSEMILQNIELAALRPGWIV
jgi:Ca2+-binding RTX toxin-like protein